MSEKTGLDKTIYNAIEATKPVDNLPKANYPFVWLLAICYR